MIGLIKMLWKFAWLTVFILGVRQAFQMIQGQMNDMIDRIEEGEAGPVESALGRLHEALHHRQVQHGAAGVSATREAA